MRIRWDAPLPLITLADERQETSTSPLSAVEDESEGRQTLGATGSQGKLTSEGAPHTNKNLPATLTTRCH